MVSGIQSITLINLQQWLTIMSLKPVIELKIQNYQFIEQNYFYSILKIFASYAYKHIHVTEIENSGEQWESIN